MRLRFAVILVFIIAFVFTFSFLSHLYVFGEEQKSARDPFQNSLAAQNPISTSTTSVASVTAQLQGLSMGPQGSFAVINGEVYREEEEKAGIKVVKIRKKEVDILMNSAPITLQMFSEGEVTHFKEKEVPKPDSQKPESEQSSEAQNEVPCDPVKGCV